MEHIKESDLFHAILPLFYVSKCLGLTPFYLDGKIGARKFKISHPALAYSITVAGLVIAVQIVRVWLNFKQDLQIVFHTTRIIYSLIYVLLSLTTPLITLIKTNTISNIINTFSDFDILLWNLVNRENYDSYRISRFILRCELLLESFLVVFIFVFVQLSSLSNLEILITELEIFLNVIATVVDLHVINLMFLLKQRFSTINSTIFNPKDQFWISVLPNDTEETLKENSLAKKVKYFRKLYSSLVDISEIIMSTYSVQMLMSVIVKVIPILHHSYFSVITIMKEDRGFYGTFTWNFFSIVILIVLTAHLIMIIWSISAATKQVSLIILNNYLRLLFCFGQFEI